MTRLLVLHGPNLNLLGTREPEVYGRVTLAQIDQALAARAREAGAELSSFQSNHEGAIVDKIQQAYGAADGIVINPAAYTHTSIAILDALKAVAIPAVEVHISDVKSREDFRQISYAGLACIKTIMGQGLDGYRQAMAFLAQMQNAE